MSLFFKIINSVKNKLTKPKPMIDITTMEPPPPIKEFEMVSKKYSDLPLPEKDASMESAVPLLKAVEKITGANAKVMALIIDLESNFRAKVKAPTSSATGWFQFINATYKTMVARHGREFGIPSTDLRTDPRVSALLGAELIKENGRILRATLKREPTILEYYIAHFLGSPVARKFLVLSDDTVVAKIMTAEAKANPWVFYDNNGRGKARTVKEVKDSLESRISKTLSNVNKYFE